MALLHRLRAYIFKLSDSLVATVDMLLALVQLLLRVSHQFASISTNLLANPFHKRSINAEYAQTLEIGGFITQTESLHFQTL